MTLDEILHRGNNLNEERIDNHEWNMLAHRDKETVGSCV